MLVDEGIDSTQPDSPTEGAAESAQTTETPAHVEAAQADASADKLLSQTEVNSLVRERLSRQTQSLLSKYGLKSLDELGPLVDSGRKYAALEETEAQEKSDLISARRELALIKNNVDESRYDDVDTYFKGKGLNLDAESLKEAIQTHPEWLKTTPAPAKEAATIRVLGNERGEAPRESERERAERLWGMKFGG